MIARLAALAAGLAAAAAGWAMILLVDPYPGAVSAIAALAGWALVAAGTTGTFLALTARPARPRHARPPAPWVGPRPGRTETTATTVRDGALWALALCLATLPAITR